MREILVAPVSRMSIFLGKMVGDSTDALIQGVIVIILGLALGINIDPLTYGVDALRSIILGAVWQPLLVDIAVIGAFDLIMIIIGTWTFTRMK
jgi:ABC-type Na+ efflux pump permease subunit